MTRKVWIRYAPLAIGTDLDLLPTNGPDLNCSSWDLPGPQPDTVKGECMCIICRPLDIRSMCTTKSVLGRVYKNIAYSTQKRYEIITCSNIYAVSALLSPYILHSKFQWWFSRVIPWDPQTKTIIWLWSAITFEVGIPGGSRNFSFSTATIWGHAHDYVHWYAQRSHGIFNDFVPPLYSTIQALYTVQTTLRPPRK